MLSEIEAFMTAHQLADVALVANAGMASEAQPEEIETAGLSFNNPRRGDPRPAHLHHVAHRAWTPWRRLCPRPLLSLRGGGATLQGHLLRSLRQSPTPELAERQGLASLDPPCRPLPPRRTRRSHTRARPEEMTAIPYSEHSLIQLQSGYAD